MNKQNQDENIKPPYADLISVLSRTLSAANHMITDLLSKEGIDNLVPSHGDILIRLFAQDELPMAALADSIGKDPSTVTALVKKLVDAGYVKTAKNTSDKRITNVSLTKKGRSLEKRVTCINEKVIAAMTDGISEEDLTTTRQILLALKANFEKETR